MPKLPTILVAGGDDLHLKLQDPFPPARCRIVHATDRVHATDHAAEASIVVVDAGLPGGGVDLCRRLRADPITTRVPLVLRVQSRGEHVQALSDARVLQSDFAGLVKTMRQLCPEVTEEPAAILDAAPPESYFENNPTAVLFRRPEPGTSKAGEWPSPPPTRAQGQDLLAFAQVYVGYLSSLVEAMEAPAKLSAAELHRLHATVGLIMEGIDQHLTALQTGITEALVGKDVERMKVLSSAKNSAYEKLQQMRGLAPKVASAAQDLPPNDAPAAAADGGAAPAPASVDGGVLSGSGLVRAESGQPDGGVSRKSELTRAAEAKEAAQKAAGKVARAERVPRAVAPSVAPSRSVAPPRSVAPSRARPAVDQSNGNGKVLLWTGLLVVSAAVAFYLYRGREHPGPAAGPTGNKAPVMKWVKLQQTPVAIVARAEAEDQERDPLAFVFRWLVNGTEVTGEKTARLLAKWYKDGDTVQLEIRPADRLQTGAPLLSSPLVANSQAQRGVPPAGDASAGN